MITTRQEVIEVVKQYLLNEENTKDFKNLLDRLLEEKAYDLRQVLDFIRKPIRIAVLQSPIVRNDVMLAIGDMNPPGVAISHKIYEQMTQCDFEKVLMFAEVYISLVGYKQKNKRIRLTNL